MHDADEIVDVDPLRGRIDGRGDVAAAILVGELAIALDRQRPDLQDAIPAAERFCGAGDERLSVAVPGLGGAAEDIRRERDRDQAQKSNLSRHGAHCTIGNTKVRLKPAITAKSLRGYSRGSVSEPDSEGLRLPHVERNAAVDTLDALLR